MWVPILINFFNIIFVILGFFGAFQYRPKYILSYCVWNGLWLGWNVFLTCFYLNVGILNKNSDLLNLGTGSFSWWLVNGPGCKPYYNGTIPDRPDLYRPDWVTGCVVDYEVVEVLHAVIQCALAVIAIIGGLFLARLFTEEDDSSQIKKKKKQPRPLYSIEYSQPEPPIAHRDDNTSPKPMTPRRVKRRSVISRDGTRRSSRRSSVRQSRRKNPINRIMEHQESLYANTPPSNLTNQNVNSLSHGTLNYDRISGHWNRDSTVSPNWQPEAMIMAASSPNIWTPDVNAYPVMPPNMVSNTNWESTSSTRNLTENWQSAPQVNNPVEIMNQMQWQGQSNPTFQQTSTQSLNGEDLDELYGNRPASARSSYSNYHGVRATPQVPQRTDIVRQSQRQFVLSGPPAYQDTVI
ncbi:sodium/potassium-transporting ATPase subunit beta-1-interacting protein isoform X2 [Phymastichus coffea]|nr:sodium/potassium-transporting ATPase subunit beta-1-interacting protein isoform X2 [Phymastichus coffea]